MTTKDDCKPEEALSFLQLYFSTYDLLTEALEKYRRLATDATTSAGRSQYRALALETERDLELLKNQRRAFLENNLSIQPPSPKVVDNAKKQAAALAQVVAKEANANQIIDIVTKGLQAFNKVVTAA